MGTMTVVVRDVLDQDLLEMRRPEMRSRSRHSRRMVPTKRSANAFARGARGGVLMTRTPSVRKHLVEAGGQLRVSVQMRNVTACERSARTELRLRACWVTHAPTGLAVTPERRTRRVSISMNNNT
jgi:hypothetical protein